MYHNLILSILPTRYLCLIIDQPSLTRDISLLLFKPLYYFKYDKCGTLRGQYNIRKKKRAHRGGKQYDGQGARHLGLEEVERRRQYAIDKQQELEARQTAKKTRREEVELAKVCKELMRFGPDLIGPSLSKPPTPAKPAPKPALRNQTKIGNTQKRRKSTVQKSRVRFIDVGVEKGGENSTTRVSSRGRIIRNRRKS